MIYMIIYIPVIVPATWILNRYGLRVSILIGAILNAVGAWLKCLSMEFSQPSSTAASAMGSSSFPILMIAQAICATGQTLLLGVPAQLAATWFGKSELALATSIGVFGNQVGCALGFGLPPLMVPSVDFSTPATFDSQFDSLKRGFRILFYGGAAIMTLDLLLVTAFFRKEPKIAPSRAQYKRILQRRGQLAGDHPTGDEVNSDSQQEVSDKITSEVSELAKQSYFHQIKFSFKSLSFIWLNICYGVNTGVYYEIGTLLSVILLEYFPTEQVAIGWVGFSMVIAGLIGSIVAGIVLKKTGLYRRVLIVFYFLSVVTMGAFTGSVFSYSIAFVFVTMILLGFFQSGFLPLGFEYAAEITYPVDEGLSSGILNTSAHIFGVILTLVATALEGKYGGLSANLFMLVSMALAAIPACFMKDDLRRQRAHEKMVIEVEGKSDEEDGDDVTTSKMEQV
uniref:MFS domain-containing protein n=2 Tax=Mesocestoides corti TaxID=53468 RepID=A0A5K3FP62_MESCO